MDKLERRALPVKMEIRNDPAKPTVITGYAAVFNSYSEDLGFFREIIRPGTFQASIPRDDVRALWNHDPNYVLGRSKAGTLAMAEDDRGLLVEIRPPETQWARDLLVSIARGDVSQMSFGFEVLRDAWHTENGQEVRELLEVKLYDVSPVTFPAYPATVVSARSAQEIYDARPQTASQAAGQSGEPAGGQVACLRDRLRLYEGERR